MALLVTTSPVDGPATVVVGRRLWLTADRGRAVEDGDPAAAFLLCGAADEVSMAEAARLGLLAPASAPVPEPEPEPEPVAKARAKPADKMRRKRWDK